MKKLIVASLILVLMIAPVNIAFAQMGNQVFVTPSSIPKEINVTTEDELILSTRWGACTPGLVKAWIQASYQQWYIDNTEILIEGSVKNYWGPVESRGPDPYCMIGSGNIWYSTWKYSIGSLPIGTYEISLNYGSDHELIDGCDYDGDGRLDRFGHWEMSVIVHVLEP